MSARPLPALALRAAGAKQQIKAAVDLLERSTAQRRLTGLNTPLAALFRLKNGPPRAPSPGAPQHAPTEAEMMAECDLARREHAPPALTRWLFGLPRGRIVERRRLHYDTLYQQALALPGARPLLGALPTLAAPYVMPLWIDSTARAEAAYAALRAAGCAVFRWDRVWPGVPVFEGDHGALWRTQVLQLLCHQDLDDTDLSQTLDVLRRAL
jgi:hypothetical protein